VALTRAKKEAVITFSKESDDGKPRLPSRFVSEIKEELLQKSEIEHEKETFFTPVSQKTKNVSLREKKYLTDLFLEEGLNVTALNNYLLCPWKYFFNNLLRIPKAMTRPQYYGMAVHSALRRISEQSALGRPASKETLLSIFSEELNRLPLTSSDHLVLLKKGKNALGGYYKQSKEALLARGFSEFNMRGILFLETTLSGTIDKMIFLPDGGTRVIDYKTRAPLSRSAILGTIKTSTGDYYRQLVFYTLLLSLYKDGSLKPKETEIDFIEPNATGKYKNEKFLVSDEDVTRLGEVIKKVSGEISKLSFWKKRCDKRNCEFCALRNLMDPSASKKIKEKNKKRFFKKHTNILKNVGMFFTGEKNKNLTNFF
jgi:DNA helicase-2/ATP-dependent DNA helicase PcrA